MKISVYVLFAFIIGFTYSCKSDDATTSSAPVTTQPSTPAAPSTASGTVEHYICPNGHVGSGGPAAGTCANCGATLEHNAAFHNNDPAPATEDVATTEQEFVDQNVNSGVEHYICPNGHVGSGGPAAGTCSNCGATLAHNDAYHNDPPPSEFVPGASPTVAQPEQIIPQPNEALSPIFQNAGAAPALGTAAGAGLASSPMPEPAQNAAGVWHYICPQGHPGGAGGASACSDCGSTLVHNTAYHN